MRSSKITLDCGDFVFIGDQPTEARSVVNDSVAAFVLDRYGHRDHLAFGARQSGGAPHEVGIVAHVPFHRRGVERVDLEDVVDTVLARIASIQFGKQPFCLVFRYPRDPRQ